MTPAVAYVGLGSNLDEPARRIALALTELEGIPATRVLRHSRLYRSAPWGLVAQPDFINAVAEIETSLSPRAMLWHLLSIERRHGRQRGEQRWGPRVMDLDLLLHADLRISEPGLELPHPRMHERAFVLVPLAELDPRLEIPGHGSVGSLLATTGDGGCIALQACAVG